MKNMTVKCTIEAKKRMQKKWNEEQSETRNASNAMEEKK